MTFYTFCVPVKYEDLVQPAIPQQFFPFQPLVKSFSCLCVALHDVFRNVKNDKNVNLTFLGSNCFVMKPILLQISSYSSHESDIAFSYFAYFSRVDLDADKYEPLFKRGIDGNNGKVKLGAVTNVLKQISGMMDGIVYSGVEIVVNHAQTDIEIIIRGREDLLKLCKTPLVSRTVPIALTELYNVSLRDVAEKLFIKLPAPIIMRLGNQRIKCGLKKDSADIVITYSKEGKEVKGSSPDAFLHQLQDLCRNDSSFNLTFLDLCSHIDKAISDDGDSWSCFFWNHRSLDQLRHQVIQIRLSEELFKL
ncbi:hypothetical protein BKA69DRAFT_1126080 [Paraphysoderma sedebokerense]|nr:hypothetical protein BKA69DRAFT_1126080 [Paraphysoderma sedebokerense]